MPNGAAHSSDAILAAARASLSDQRAGGRRVVAGPAIGRGSAAIRRAHQWRQMQRMLGWVIAIVVAGWAAGWVLHGIGIAVMVMTALAVVVAMVALARAARPLVVPAIAQLRDAPTPALIGQTQLWLEAQRPALPAPAVLLVDRIGGQLDVLGGQLAGLDSASPAAGQVRQLVAEHLPELVGAYTAIPVPLRHEQRAGQTPDDQLTESLTRISAEIDSVTRQLAEGSLDRLAIQNRFLDYKYGSGPDSAP
jgi:hypothetical protein